MYILEKISQNASSLSKTVAETFGINTTTVHSYINELVNEGIIRKVKRGQYELVKNEYSYELSRDKGDLDSDTYALEEYLYQHIKDFPINVVSIWNYVFSEMMNNVMDHSLAPHAKLVVSQDYLTTTVWIFDDGVGIFEKIKEYFKLPTIDEAICELFKGKLTTDHKNHSGEGIFFRIISGNPR